MADVEDLTGVGSSGTQGVLAECLGVAAGGTLLLLAVDLFDGAVDVDGHRGFARSSPEGPGPNQQLLTQRIEQAGVSEGEGPQERAEGGRGRGTLPAPSSDQARHWPW
jgi:hypothetical protein